MDLMVFRRAEDMMRGVATGGKEGMINALTQNKISCEIRFLITSESFDCHQNSCSCFYVVIFSCIEIKWL